MSGSIRSENSSTWPSGARCLALLIAMFVSLSCPRAHAACGDPSKQCDSGSGAFVGPSCCLSDCTIAPAGRECRPSAGICDVAERCSGLGPACPVDTFASDAVVCRSSVASCDVAETCSGTAASCPADTGQPDGDDDQVCDAQDNCPLVRNPTQTDGDQDGLGDACDPCTAVGDGAITKPHLSLGKLSAPGDDDSFKVTMNLEVPGTPDIEPLLTGIRLLLAGPRRPVFDVQVPPTAYRPDTRVGWRSVGDRRWLYLNPEQATRPGGIKRIFLREDPDRPGQLKLGITGRGGDLRAAVGQQTLTLTVVIDAPFATTGQCAAVTFVTSGQTSDCRLLNGYRRLICSLNG